MAEVSSDKIVPCHFFGCSANVKQSELEKHCQENVENHLKVHNEMIKELGDRVEQLTTTVNSIKREQDDKMLLFSSTLTRLQQSVPSKYLFTDRSKKSQVIHATFNRSQAQSQGYTFKGNKKLSLATSGPKLCLSAESSKDCQVLTWKLNFSGNTSYLFGIVDHNHKNDERALVQLNGACGWQSKEHAGGDTPKFPNSDRVVTVTADFEQRKIKAKSAHSEVEQKIPQGIKNPIYLVVCLYSSGHCSLV